MILSRSTLDFHGMTDGVLRIAGSLGCTKVFQRFLCYLFSNILTVSCIT